MKRYSLLFFLLCGMVGTAAYADPVSRQKAEQTAAAYAKSGSSPKLVKSAARKKANSRVATTDAPLYIFSRGEGQGFVIVSGDDCLPEVLGYTDSGDFDEANMPPALLDMLDGYAELVEQAQEAGAPARAPQKISASWTSIAPLISTHWHQSEPYYNRCPMRIDSPTDHCLTGCTCTAAAQVAYYWHKDANKYTQYDTPDYTYGDNMESTSTVKTLKGTPYKWELMQMSYNSSTPAAMRDAVATLMNVIGISLYQTYGSSTSGQIGNIVNVYNGQIGLSSTCWYKSGNSQSYWEQLIYDDLAAGRPIVYAGVHPSNGGHAIVLDGYDAGSGKFHFNFGWGGQGDGYYTVDDETGVNGFSSQQGMTFRVQAKKQNLTGSLVLPKSIFQSHTNTISASVTNNGTLAYSGLYLFASQTKKQSFAVSSATSSETTTSVATDATQKVSFTHKPLKLGTWYYYLTDANGNLLATDSATIVAAHADLHFKSITVSASDETETVGANTYGVVYNTKATVSIDLANVSATDNYEGAPRCELYVSTDGGATFTNSTYRSASTAIGTGETATLNFAFSSLSEDNLYYAKLRHPITTTTTNDEVTFDSNDTIVYFKVKAADLAVASTEGNCVKLTGKWNSDKFTTLAKTNATATSYDLTDVTGVTDIPTVENPNTLFYVADNANATGRNIVKGNVCDNLLLTYGYDFEPKSNFTATNAALLHTQAAGDWAGIILPFDCTTPTGIWTRKVTQLKSGFIYQYENTTTLKAGTPYLMVNSSAQNDRFTATNVLVTTTAQSECTDSLQGTFVQKAATATIYIVDNSTGYFEAAGEGTPLPAFSAYIDYGRRVRLASSSAYAADITYLELADAIEAAYNTLNEYADATTDEAKTAYKQAIADAESILTNQTLTTRTTIQEAIDTLNKAGETYKATDENTTADIDCTDKIVNPSFESARTGWTLDANSIVKATSDLAYLGVGTDATHLLYNCVTAADSTSTEMSQTITGLENGYYRLTAMVGTAPGNTVGLFAGEKTTNVDAAELGTYYLTEGVVDSVLVTDGTLTIGVKGGAKWYKVDDFHLYYLGEKTEETGIDLVRGDNSLRIWGGEGCIFVQTDTDATISVYTLSGMMQKRINVKAGQTEIGGLAKGLYIVNRQKVMVR